MTIRQQHVHPFTDTVQDVSRACAALSPGLVSVECRNSQRTATSHQRGCDTDDDRKSVAREGDGLRDEDRVSHCAARRDGAAGVWRQSRRVWAVGSRRHVLATYAVHAAGSKTYNHR